MEIDSEIPPANAVSLYGESSDAMDDFPILKAFQEYVDKEQAKARRRMTGLTFLFLFILSGAVGGLGFVIYQLNLRNEALNDRLVEFAMNDRAKAPAQTNTEQVPPQPIVVQAPQQDNTALIAMVESLKSLIEEQKKTASLNPPTQPVAPAAPVGESISVGPSPEQLAMEKKLKEQQERIEKTTALLKAQEEAIAAQKAQLREQELEAYRRKHYPEYYQRIEQPQQIIQQSQSKPEMISQPSSTKSVSASKKRAKIVEIVEDIIDDDEIEDMLDTEDDIDDIDTEDEEFEDYYTEDDEDYEIPVDSGANWLIPKE